MLAIVAVESSLVIYQKYFASYFLIKVLHLIFRITKMEARIFSMLSEVHHGRNFVPNFCWDDFCSGKCETMVFCYQNCSDLLWSRKKFEIRGWSLWTICSNSKRSECFLNLNSCRFLRSNEWEQLEFKLEEVPMYTKQHVV